MSVFGETIISVSETKTVQSSLGKVGTKAVSGMCEPGTLHGNGLIDSLQLFPIWMLLQLGSKFLEGGIY